MKKQKLYWVENLDHLKNLYKKTKRVLPKVFWLRAFIPSTQGDTCLLPPIVVDKLNRIQEAINLFKRKENEI